MLEKIAESQETGNNTVTQEIEKAVARSLSDLKAEVSDLVDTKVMLESNYTRQRLTLNFKIAVLRRAIEIKESRP